MHGVAPLKVALKSTLLGKVAAALRRQRRAPVRAVRSRLAARRDGPPPSPDPTSRRFYRAVFIVLCGPGELDALSDTLASIEHYEGSEVKTIVVDDATADARWPQVLARHPTVDVIRSRWPTGGPPRLSPLLALAYRTALDRYDFDVACKLDTDALLCGSGFSAGAARAFATPSTPARAGMLGTFTMRADGALEDFAHDRWVLAHESRWSPTVRDRFRQAWGGRLADVNHVHGGVYVISRAALDAVASSGGLDRQPPWWSQMPEDLWWSMAIVAAGFELGSWGAPGEPIACGSKFLPVALSEIDAREVKAIHSVRRGLAGENEHDIRAFFAGRRALPEQAPRSDGHSTRHQAATG